MEIQPVKKYPKPSYPDKEEANNNPKMLKQVPYAWRKKPLVTAAVIATFITGICKMDDISFKGAGFSDDLSVPFFEYGNGRGSFGCMSVAAPVFLSEEEARQVILEEALKYGLSFKDNKTIKTKIPVTYLSENKMDLIKGKLELDGYDETGIGFEFVSKEDYLKFNTVNDEMLSSVVSYNIKDAAKAISDNIDNTAVFYDPISYDSEKYRYGTEEESKELLRKQVKDFIEWLIGQGVI